MLNEVEAKLAISKLKSSQETSKSDRETPKVALGGSRRPQDGPKTGQDASKTSKKISEIALGMRKLGKVKILKKHWFFPSKSPLEKPT
jgi:hypothetical protein